MHDLLNMFRVLQGYRQAENCHGSQSLLQWQGTQGRPCSEIEIMKKGLRRCYDRSLIKITEFKLCKTFPRAIKAQISLTEAIMEQLRVLVGKQSV